MRYAIFSDIHSNLEALHAVIAAYKKESIDQYICAGDLVGYAANPRECIAEVKKLNAVIVAGNHDYAAAGVFPTEYFNRNAAGAILWTQNQIKESEINFLKSLELINNNKDFTVVHGTLDAPADFNYMVDYLSAARSFDFLDKQICFIGHTHVPGVFIKEKGKTPDYQQVNKISIREEASYIINVGSVGQPRDDNPSAAYSVYDSDKREVRIKRVDYDISAARKKIIESGLPQFLADRLMVGK